MDSKFTVMVEMASLIFNFYLNVAQSKLSKQIGPKDMCVRARLCV